MWLNNKGFVIIDAMFSISITCIIVLLVMSVQSTKISFNKSTEIQVEEMDRVFSESIGNRKECEIQCESTEEEDLL